MEDFKDVKIEIYIPEEYVEHLREALHAANIGRVGYYDHCLSISKVRGYWRPLEGARPFVGRVGVFEEGQECKVEIRCDRCYVAAALKAVRKIHPYEEPLINVIPLANALFE